MALKTYSNGINISMLFKILILFLIYLFTAKLGLSIYPVSHFATLVWLPSGISLAALLIFGYKLWPGVYLGAVLANILTGAPILTALIIGIGNTLEPFLAAFILKKYFHFINSLERLKDVLGLIIISAIFATMVSATIGVLSLWLGGVINKLSLLSTWLAWWIGDMISILVITPVFLSFSNKFKINIKPGRSVEFLVLFVLFVLIYLVVFGDRFYFNMNHKPIAYFMFPILIWISLRFGIKGASVMTLLLSTLSTLSTLLGQGPFVSDNPSTNLISLQTYIAVTSVTTLIVASVMSERKSLEKAKDQFITIAAHEFKTPATTIKGYTQLLQKVFENSKDRKIKLYISHMNNQVDNLTRLISDFFDASKIRLEKMELNMEYFNYDLFVKEVVKDARQLTKKHKIIILGKTEKEVYADKYRISQVLTNILSNAIKFSPKSNKINLYLSSGKFEAKTCIQDFGIGISQRDLEHIFERFYQAKTQIRHSVGGLGLGMYISSQIIIQHGGQIWVKSEKGKGSTFCFSLPLVNK